MSPEIIQKLIAGVLIVGGIGGGYYALTGGKSSTLEGMHLALSRDLVEDWELIENKYKDEGNNKDLIDGIPIKASKLKDKIKKWCKSNGNTYYLDSLDKTYRSYSVWCLKEVNLENALTKRGFKWENDKWDKKFEKYKTSNQSFLTEETPSESKLQSWCGQKKLERYKYIGDEIEYKVRSYCYWTEEEIESFNKKPELASTQESSTGVS